MNDLMMLLDVSGRKHLYEQIYEYIRDVIREGKLQYGEQLPSTRLLASQLQIARSTVEQAYEQLVSEGYIEARPYRGFFVCNVEGLAAVPSMEERAHEPSGDSQAAGPAAGQEDAAPVLYDFSPHGIDMSGFPFDTWKRIYKKVLLDRQEDILQAGDSQGEYELRHTLSHYLRFFRGVDCRPQQIIIGAGNDYLLLLLGKILGQGRRIAMENATYLRACRIFQSSGCQICVAADDSAGMQVSELERLQAEIAYVMPTHQFPKGTVMPVGRRMELLAWANAQEGRFIIEDDYDSEFRYRGKPIPALQSLDLQGKVIHMGTFSKSVAPAIRMGYLVLPASLCQSYHAECSFFSSTVSRIEQAVLSEFIRSGSFERHLNKMRKVYRQKHDALLGGIAPLRESFTVSGEDAGVHLILTPRGAAEGLTPQELEKRAIENGCRVYGISRYQIEKRDTGEILLGYASLSLEQIEKGTAALVRAWTDLPAAVKKAL